MKGIVPLKRLRGRHGIWVPGDAALPPRTAGAFTRISEGAEAINFMMRISVTPRPTREIMQRIYHVPNGGTRAGREGAIFKAQGLRAGVPDYCLPVKSRGFAGLYIELKARDGEMSKAQKDELFELHAAGYRAVCAWGSEAAYEELLRYVEG